jgi:hypothetical protein
MGTREYYFILYTKTFADIPVYDVICGYISLLFVQFLNSFTLFQNLIQFQKYNTKLRLLKKNPVTHSATNMFHTNIFILATGLS